MKQREQERLSVAIGTLKERGTRSAEDKKWLFFIKVNPTEQVL
jgi:hypothetical protein